jgi:hypothetical protein
VLSQRPEDRFKVVIKNNGKIIRASTSELDVMHQVCYVQYRLWELKGDRVVNETSERHTMRFFFAQEIEFIVQKITGFGQVGLRKFPNIDELPDEESWNVIAIARK